MSVFLPGFLCLEFLPRDPFIINRALKKHTTEFRASQVALVVKNLPANAGDVKAIALIPGSGRPPGVKHGKRVRHNWSDLVWTHETEFNMQRFTSSNFSKYFITQIHRNIQYKCISKILFSLKKNLGTDSLLYQNLSILHPKDAWRVYLNAWFLHNMLTYIAFFF